MKSVMFLKQYSFVNKYNILEKILLLISSAGLITLTGCASSSSPHYNRYHNRGTKSSTNIPKVPMMQIPGGNTNNWRYLGTTANGQLIAEINDTSITKLDSTQQEQYKFQDRKTVYNPSTFSYPPNIPHYKYLLESWLINCQSKQYLLQNATLFDEFGNKIKDYNYTNDNQIRWMEFGDDSIANSQYQYVCLGQNRNLGY